MTKDKRQNKKSKNSFFVEKISEKTKESFLIDIQNLRHKLQSLEEKKENSENKKKILIEKINTVFAGKDEFLKKYNDEAEEKTQEFTDLQERIRGLEERKDFEKEGRREVLSEAKEKLQKMKNNFSVENKHLAARKRDIEDFKYIKKEMEGRIEKLKRRLKENEEKHVVEVEGMEEERKNEIRKIRNEALEELQRAGLELREDCRSRMPGTIRRATSENHVIQHYLDKMGHFSEENEAENKKIREEMASNSSVCRKLAKNEKKLLEEFVATKKVIKLLEKKTKEYEETKKEYWDDGRVVEELEDEIKEIHKMMDATKREGFKSQKFRSRLKASITDYNGQLERYEEDIAQLELTIQQAVKPMKSTIFANRSARKDHYLRGNLDKYRDVLVDVYGILKNHK